MLMRRVTYSPIWGRIELVLLCKVLITPETSETSARFLMARFSSLTATGVGVATAEMAPRDKKEKRMRETIMFKTEEIVMMGGSELLSGALRTVFYRFRNRAIVILLTHFCGHLSSSLWCTKVEHIHALINEIFLCFICNKLQVELTV